jgi:flap endonuclease GEN
MTVASLWKALDSGKSGRPVGANDIAKKPEENDPEVRNCETTTAYSNRAALAVDLSIWICESLTCHGLKENHANPSLHLVFTRTVKLLSLGIKLIFVIEGKRRIRGDPGEKDAFHKRRSGTAFWKACRDCQQLLELLGVPVVRAKAEGEALCALLNQRGIVDGVISNDGDCLLFGATTLYTKFSIENLENAQVVRYDLSDLKAVASNEDGDEGCVKLSREDLVAFALLTGSDLAGNGLEKVGHKKAIRFIKKCQEDYPLTAPTAAMDELRAWARAAKAGNVATDNQECKSKQCSRCCHAGSKRHHEKHGCEICGTEPGEPCYNLSADDRFRKSLRAKALAARPKFEPAQVVDAYMRPNDNQMPIQFAQTTSQSLQMNSPRMNELLRMPVVIRGSTIQASRDYVKQTVARLLSRNELFAGIASTQAPQGRQRLSRERPVPQKITKQLIQNKIPCYEVLWLVGATLTDADGEGIDGYEYSSVEPRDMIQKCYPELVSSFQQEEKERQKQGDAEQIRRRAFLEKMFVTEGVDDEGMRTSPIKCPKQQVRKRHGFFENHRGRKGLSLKRPKGNHISDDVAKLLGMSKLVGDSKEAETLKHHGDDKQPQNTPEKPLYCRMGGIMVEITPIVANHGAYPPRQIFVRSFSTSSPLTSR